jgi:hypothetical protein
MNADDTLQLLDNLFAEKPLIKLQTLIFQQSFQKRFLPEYNQTF